MYSSKENKIVGSSLDRAGLTLRDARGTNRVGALTSGSKTEGGSHLRNFQLFVFQMVQIEKFWNFSL